MSGVAVGGEATLQAGPRIDSAKQLAKIFRLVSVGPRGGGFSRSTYSATVVTYVVQLNKNQRSTPHCVISSVQSDYCKDAELPLPSGACRCDQDTGQCCMYVGERHWQPGLSIVPPHGARQTRGYCIGLPRTVGGASQPPSLPCYQQCC